MKYKAVFFDFDGTLMDTSEGIIECGKHSMEFMGLKISPDVDWNTFIGPPLEQCFMTTHGITDKKTLLALCKEYRNYYYSTALFKAKFYDGIVDVLKELRKRGYYVGCASMKHEGLVKNMMEHFDVSKYFDVVLGLDVEEKFNKGMLIKLGCSKLGIKPDEAVLVGDTEFDSRGAEEAGCSMIKVNWGFGYKKNCKDTISSPYEILDSV